MPSIHAKFESSVRHHAIIIDVGLPMALGLACLNSFSCHPPFFENGVSIFMVHRLHSTDSNLHSFFVNKPTIAIIQNMGDICKILDSKWPTFHNSFSTFFQSLDGKIFASIEVASKYHFSEMTSAEDGTKLEVIQTH